MRAGAKRSTSVGELVGEPTGIDCSAPVSVAGAIPWSSEFTGTTFHIEVQPQGAVAHLIDEYGVSEVVQLTQGTNTLTRTTRMMCFTNAWSTSADRWVRVDPQGSRRTGGRSTCIPPETPVPPLV